MNSRLNEPRLLLAKLRQGDYAHPGEEEAIELVIERALTHLSRIIANDPQQLVLDVGSGLGGTAEYLRKRLNATVYGIDIDKNAIKYAKSRYTKINFMEGDATTLETKDFSGLQFDLIYLFNVYYAFTNPKKALENFSRLAKKDSLLIIFDYSQRKHENLGIKDFAEKPMHPIVLENIKEDFKEAGWELIEVVDISEKYESWYKVFLSNLEKNKSKLLNEFSENSYNKVLSTFSFLTKKITDKAMGGSILIGKNIKPMSKY